MRNNKSKTRTVKLINPRHDIVSVNHVLLPKLESPKVKHTDFLKRNESPGSLFSIHKNKKFNPSIVSSPDPYTETNDQSDMKKRCKSRNLNEANFVIDYPCSFSILSYFIIKRKELKKLKFPASKLNYSTNLNNIEKLREIYNISNLDQVRQAESIDETHLEFTKKSLEYMNDRLVESLNNKSKECDELFMRLNEYKTSFDFIKQQIQQELIDVMMKYETTNLALEKYKDKYNLLKKELEECRGNGLKQKVAARISASKESNNNLPTTADILKENINLKSKLISLGNSFHQSRTTTPPKKLSKLSLPPKFKISSPNQITNKSIPTNLSNIDDTYKKLILKRIKLRGIKDRSNTEPTQRKP